MQTPLTLLSTPSETVFGEACYVNASLKPRTTGTSRSPGVRASGGQGRGPEKKGQEAENSLNTSPKVYSLQRATGTLCQKVTILKRGSEMQCPAGPGQAAFCQRSLWDTVHGGGPDPVHSRLCRNGWAQNWFLKLML